MCSNRSTSSFNFLQLLVHLRRVGLDNLRLIRMRRLPKRVGDILLERRALITTKERLPFRDRLAVDSQTVGVANVIASFICVTFALQALLHPKHRLVVPLVGSPTRELNGRAELKRNSRPV